MDLREDLEAALDLEKDELHEILESTAENLCAVDEVPAPVYNAAQLLLAFVHLRNVDHDLQDDVWDAWQDAGKDALIGV